MASAAPSQDGGEALDLAAPAWTADVPDEPLESLRAVAAELAGALSLDRVAAVVATAVSKAVGADIILVGVYEETGRQVRVVHERGLSPTARRRLPGVLSAASSALRTHEPSGHGPALDSIAAALVGHSPPDGSRSSQDGRRRAAGPRALAAVIPADERPLGLIVAGHTQDGTFSAAQRAFVNALAAIVTLALERLRAGHDPRYLRSAPSRQQLELRHAGSHVQVGDMQIDLEGQEALLPHRRVHLTPSELRILLYLAAEPGRVRTRRDILRHLWHTDHVGDERACDAHISNLRRKIERDPSRPNRVVTVRGLGYALHTARNGA